MIYQGFRFIQQTLINFPQSPVPSPQSPVPSPLLLKSSYRIRLSFEVVEKIE
ncbi:hypothetical protein [Sphaerospermopsis sp. FACHB-1194]|uniref:hypothetical protein n=1 Tax=Sphaerospermopsis sp. FACHB-1194 TaxID=2692862 RepID=UPI0016819BE8|nr:hypothetical protein [Sphaerospermopsis sp. FACHB-1194]